MASGCPLGWNTFDAWASEGLGLLLTIGANLPSFGDNSPTTDAFVFHVGHPLANSR